MEGVKYTPILNDFATLNYQDPVRPNTPDVVYNPLYQETVLKYSQENCASYRKSLLKVFKGDEEAYYIAKSLCDVLPLHDINWVMGPVSYTEIIIPNSSKKIGIFGEIHNVNLLRMSYQDSVTMSSFLLAIGDAFPSRRYDILVEIDCEDVGVERQSTGGSSPTISSIYAYFKDCMSESKREKCDYNNLHFHTIDYRNVTKHIFSRRVYSPFCTEDDIKKIIKDKTVQEYAEAEIKNIIRYMNEDKNMQTSPILKDILDATEKYLVGYYINMKMQTYTDLHVFLQVAYGEILNMYTMTRIFSEDIGDNVILYVGASHEPRIRDFLVNKMNGVVTEHVFYRNTAKYGLEDIPNFLAVYPLKTKSFLFV